MNAFTDSTYEIRGPAYTFSLSTVDQVQVPIYPSRLLIFSHSDTLPAEETIDILRTGIQRTVNEIPVLAGRLAYAPNGGWTVKPDTLPLRVRYLDDVTFNDLAKRNFPEEMLPANKVISAPEYGDPYEDLRACFVQATFIKGGLLLAVSIHHVVMDGYGITKVTEALARNCRHGMTAEAPDPIPVTVDRTTLFKRYESSDVSKIAYTTDPAAQFTPLPGKTFTKTYRLSPEAVKQLKKDASPANSDDWISTADAVCALFWKAQVVARFGAGRISGGERIPLSFAKDIRQLIGLPTNYIGNAALMTEAYMVVDELVNPEGLATAAYSIRKSIRAVDDIYAANFVAVTQSLKNPLDMKIGNMIGSADKMFIHSSWRGFDASGEDWDSLLGTYERMRLPLGVGARGVFVIWPTLSDGTWEVTLMMEEDLGESFLNNPDLKRYTH